MGVSENNCNVLCQTSFLSTVSHYMIRRITIGTIILSIIMRCHVSVSSKVALGL